MGNKDKIISFLKQRDYIMVNGDLGRGSFGKTVLLKDPFIDELFVAKKYQPEDKNDSERFYRNFLDEIKILYKLNHPNIVRVYGYYAYEEIYTGYILMEYINGKSLDEHFNGEKIDVDSIFKQIISAFCCIEQNHIVHRDIRENNILVTDDGQVKIIDFGIGKIHKVSSKDSGASRDSLAGEINRPDTLPNEYYNEKYTIKTDMFYIGELLNRLLIKNNLNPSFSYGEMLEKMMERDPDKRYASFTEIKQLISRKTFDNLKFSDNDVKIYKNFADEIFKNISVFNDTPLFVDLPSDFVSGLEKVVQNNLFEEYIQNNSDLISCIVSSSFRFYNKESILCETVRNFLEWFKNYDTKTQEVILANLVNKLSRVDVDIEVPF